jgi:hypothetical protein
MGSASTRKLEGFATLGGELPFLKPHSIKIVGVDLDETGENWFAFCPRAGEKLEDEWLADIRQNGVRQPVDVFRDGDSVIMLEGRRRVTAARIIYDEQKKAGVPEAERITVRVNVRRGTPLQLFGFNVGSENRKERTPMQRAALMMKAQQFGADNAALATMFNCSTQTVKNMLSLLDLASDVQRAVDKGELPIREAIKLTDMPREEQKLLLTSLKEADATKGARASNGIAAAKKGEKVTNNTRKMRSRGFLEKWREVVKADEKFCAVKVPLNDILKFILGSGVPADFPERVKESLIEAGLKQKKAAA